MDVWQKPKFVVVVTPKQSDCSIVSSIQRSLRNDSPWESVVETVDLPPFSQKAMDFVSSLSSTILKTPEAKRFPEAIALGFWLRRSNIQRIIEGFLKRRPSNSYYSSRGLAFHIAPSNVDTIFVYSWILALLCGNRNIVRISTRQSRQMQVLLNCIDDVLAQDDHREISRRLSVIRYDSTDELTARISKSTDIRVVWGGDQTVLTIRKIPLPPTSIDLSFANKWSIALIDLDSWQSQSDAEKSEIARKFSLDSFQFGQAACSSPRCVVWINRDRSEFETDEFWKLVYKHLEDLFEFAEVDYVNKLVASDVLAANGLVRRKHTQDNRVIRLEIDGRDIKNFIHRDEQCDAGFFLECQIDDLGVLLSQVDRKVQTISSFGISSQTWDFYMMQGNVKGLDRVVPFGKALDFDVCWDGFDLLSSFTRLISVNLE